MVIFIGAAFLTYKGKIDEETFLISLMFAGMEMLGEGMLIATLINAL